MAKNKWIFWVSIVLTLILSISLFCANILARRFPINFILLTIFTLSTTYMIASICIFQDPETVLIAAALTLSVFTALTLFTFFVCFKSPHHRFQTNTDLHMMWALLFIVIHILVAMIPLLIVFRHRIIFIAVCIAMLLLFSLFIIYDTKVIAGGEKYGLGVDDYIVGALLLYTVRINLSFKVQDIITMFIWLLMILASAKRSGD